MFIKNLKSITYSAQPYFKDVVKIPTNVSPVAFVLPAEDCGPIYFSRWKVLCGQLDYTSLSICSFEAAGQLCH